MTQLVNFAYSEDPWFFDTKCHICETLSVTIRIWFCLFFMELDNVPQNRLSFLIAFLKCRIQWMPVAVAAICMHIHCYIFLFYLNQASFCLFFLKKWANPGLFSFIFGLFQTNNTMLGGGPGLVVMGGDSRS